MTALFWLVPCSSRPTRRRPSAALDRRNRAARSSAAAKENALIRTPVTIVLIAVLTVGSRSAASSRAGKCRQSCGSAIAACIARNADVGGLRSACKAAVIKRCRTAGMAVCTSATETSTTTTTSTTSPTSPTTTTTLAIREYGLPAGSHPAAIVAGPDGNMWFAELGRDRIANVTSGGTVTEYATASAGCAPGGVTLGPDGRIWYTCTGSAHVGVVPAAPSPANPIVEFSSSVTPYGPITSGPSGLLWFTDSSGEVAAFDVDAHTVPAFIIVTDHSFVGVATGGDGRLWASDASGYVWEARRTDTGTTSQSQPLPTVTGYPYLIAWCQPWGGAWLAEGAGNNLAFVPRSTAPIVEVPLPTPGSSPYAVACAADGSVWYTAPGANRVGRYKRDGTFEELDVPTANANVDGIAVAGDGSIWFTEFGADKVARLSPSSP